MAQILSVPWKYSYTSMVALTCPNHIPCMIWCETADLFVAAQFGTHEFFQTSVGHQHPMPKVAELNTSGYFSRSGLEHHHFKKWSTIIFSMFIMELFLAMSSLQTVVAINRQRVTGHPLRPRTRAGTTTGTLQAVGCALVAQWYGRINPSMCEYFLSNTIHWYTYLENMP